MRLTKMFFKVCLIVCSVAVFAACGSDGDDEIKGVDYLPGKIPGLGEAEGNLTGKQFVLPDGIELEGVIKGLSSSVFNIKSSISPALFPEIHTEKAKRLEEKGFALRASAQPEIAVGSGYYVRVLVILNNKNNADKEVLFPAGLIVRALSTDNQSGVLLKKTSVTVPKNGSLNVGLILYCGNASRDPSGSYDEYEWGVVTDSKLILDLCDRLKNKKINYEEFAKADYSIYKEQVDNLQSILWGLTDGYSEYSSGLTDEQKEYIANLPNSK